MEVRQLDERRFVAITSLRAMVEALKETNPVAIFPSEKAGILDSAKTQTIANRWADKAADVLLRSLDLADRIGVDALDLFDGTKSERRVVIAEEGVSELS
jgi:hypothetical protein